MIRRSPTDLAEQLARRVHVDQLDKADEPYIGHCERVVAKLTDERAKTVAWLHDVLEDTKTSEAALRGHSTTTSSTRWSPSRIRRSSSKDEYYARVRANGLALQVKYADIHDNLDPSEDGEARRARQLIG